MASMVWEMKARTGDEGKDRGKDRQRWQLQRQGWQSPNMVMSDSVISVSLFSVISDSYFKFVVIISVSFISDSIISFSTFWLYQIPLYQRAIPQSCSSLTFKLILTFLGKVRLTVE